MRPVVAPFPTIFLSVALASGTACAPPDPISLVDSGSDTEVVEADPSIRILFPELDDNGQVRVELTDSCAIEQLFVLDVDNFELVPPNTAANSDGQGHVHVALGEDYDATSSATMVFRRAGIDASSALVPASFGFIRVSLQANDHSDLDQFPEWEHQVEYYVEDPSGACL
jgi:hypothetical protein